MENSVEVLITLPFSEDLITQLEGVSPRLVVNAITARDLDDVPEEIWERVEILYTNRIIPDPDQASRLLWIQFHWAGVDHALDESILQRPDLVATNLSGASASQMAEHAVMMMLALGHHLPDAQDLQIRTEWPKGRWERFRPQELRGSTVGIVGYGSIGRQIARLLNTFGAQVLATKRDAMHPEDTGYTVEGLGDPEGDLAHRLYPTQALRSMLKECDFVIVTVPRTDETLGIIGAGELEALKPEAYLVDISRGGIVDHEALVLHLKEGGMAGAALDVFPEEPLPEKSPLWKLPNVIITPHISGFSPHYDARAVHLFTENLHRYMAGLPLFNRVNLDRGY
jgi:phosphoglycerate dehydrogenase-like enzyme